LGGWLMVGERFIALFNLPCPHRIVCRKSCRLRGEEVVACPLYRKHESEEEEKMRSIIRKYIKAIR